MKIVKVMERPDSLRRGPSKIRSQMVHQHDIPLGHPDAARLEERGDNRRVHACPGDLRADPLDGAIRDAGTLRDDSRASHLAACLLPAPYGAEEWRHLVKFLKQCLVHSLSDP